MSFRPFPQPTPKGSKYLKFTKEIFDENDRLIPFTEDDWDDEWIRLVESGVTEDDIPF